MRRWKQADLQILKLIMLIAAKDVMLVLSDDGTHSYSHMLSFSGAVVDDVLKTSS